MRILELALVGLAVSGCQSTLHSGKKNPGDVDAGIKFPDAPIPEDAAIDAPPACAMGRQVYLNFGGGTLTRAATSDARNNLVQWGGGNIGTQYNIPAYQNGNAASATTVGNAIIAGLAPYPDIKVTLTRPQTGNYVMIMFGGQPGTIGVAGVYDFAVASQDCNDTNKNDVGIVLDDVGNLTQAANFGLGAIGFGLGMVGTGNGGNCMCAWATNCQPGGAACTFATINGNTGQCPGHTNPQDQAAVLGSFCK